MPKAAASCSSEAPCGVPKRPLEHRRAVRPAARSRLNRAGSSPSKIPPPSLLTTTTHRSGRGSPGPIARPGRVVQQRQVPDQRERDRPGDGRPHARAPRPPRWRTSRRSRSRPCWRSPGRPPAAAAAGRRPARTVSYRTTAARPPGARRPVRWRPPAPTSSPPRPGVEHGRRRAPGAPPPSAAAPRRAASSRPSRRRPRPPRSGCPGQPDRGGDVGRGPLRVGPHPRPGRDHDVPDRPASRARREAGECSAPTAAGSGPASPAEMMTSAGAPP